MNKEGSAVPDRHTVIFDGECGVCVKVIGYFQQRAAPGRLTFLPYQSTNLQELLPGLTEDKTSRALYFVSEKGEHYSGARAMFATMREMRGAWKVSGAVWSFWPLALFAEPFYRLFAMNRRRVSRWLGLAQCPIPRRIGGAWDEGRRAPD